MHEQSRQDVIADDVRTLHRLGYAQKLLRRMSGFSNFAISLSIICILAGGVTSFHVGYCSVGGASIGLGWPLVCLFSLAVAATMAQIASAFPTAGGLYHWASILGGRGWGWTTAWFNLVGLIFVLAAINAGCFRYLFSSLNVLFDLGWTLKPTDSKFMLLQFAAVLVMTVSQALVNHFGIRVTTLLTDFSGWWILIVAVALTVGLLLWLPSLHPERLVTFVNYSGKGEVFAETGSIPWLFLLGFLLPAYTITGFDASAHTSEETIGAARTVPRAIVRSVLVSGVFGWIMLSAAVLAIRDPDRVAEAGGDAFATILKDGLPALLAVALTASIGLAQYLCGLATVTSASRMAYAFARDGGLPMSSILRHIHPEYRTPVPAIWTVAAAALVFTIFSPVYDAIAAAAAMLLYVSYVLPTALGFVAHGKRWKQMGPWHLGRWFRPLAVIAIAGCLLLLVIGMAPPNENNVLILAAFVILLLAGWILVERRRFAGPPVGDVGKM
jgi:amino acid transporter